MKTRLALDISKKLNLSQKYLKLVDETSDKYAQYNIGPEDQPGKYDESKGDILFPIIQTGSKTRTFVSVLLACAFQTRGYNPVVLRCHNDMDVCMRKDASQSSTVCEQCQYEGKKALDGFDFTFFDMREISSKGLPTPDQLMSSEEEGVFYKGVNLAPFCKSSTRKHQRKHHIDLGEGQDREIYKSYLESAIKITAASQKVLDNYEIKAVVSGTQSYIYSLPLEVARLREVNSVTFGSGRIPNTILFSNYYGFGTIYNGETTKYKQSVMNAVSDKERRLVDKIMKNRMSGEGATDVYSSLKDKSVSVNPEKTQIGVFTNLIWDGSLQGTGEGITDVFEWLKMTIEKLDSEETIQTFIKTHPAELRGTNERVDYWIQDNFNLSSETTIIPPESDVNTYKLIDDIDIAVVYNSTVGIEAAYKETPVIVGGNPHYRDLGFTYDAESKQHYENLLEGCEIKLEYPEEYKQRLYSFLKYYFLEKHIYNEYYSKKDTSQRKLEPISYRRIERNDLFDKIIECIINGKPIHIEKQETEIAGVINGWFDNAY